MSTPSKLTVSRVHALLDAVIALFAGRRDPRSQVIDPVAFVGGATVWWVPTEDRTAATAAGAGGVATYPIPLNVGDRLQTVVVHLQQAGAAAVTATIYELAGGARTALDSITTATAITDYQALSLEPGHTVTAGTAIVLELVAGSAGDQFAGALATFDHPP